MILNIFKTAGVVIVAGTLSTLIIHAGDSLLGGEDSFLASVSSVFSSDDCMSGMVEVSAAEGTYCIDRYEASAGAGCAHAIPRSLDETIQNINDTDCEVVSAAGAAPWTNVAQHQAELLCAKVGKRLPTSQEWYQASLGTRDVGAVAASKCNLGKSGSEGPEKTGMHTECVSAYGAEDLIGNVWEWVHDEVVDGERQGKVLPSPGYVSGVDMAGIPISTSEKSDPLFNGDKFWVDKKGTRGVFRGGYYGSQEEAGIYAVHAGVSPSFTGAGVGFRCVE